MERIKVLCRILCVIALTVFILSFVPEYFVPATSHTEAYETFLSQVQKIQAYLQVNEEDFALISEVEFQNELSSDEIRQRVQDMFEDRNLSSIYAEETIHEVADQIITLYEAQQVLCNDVIYADYMKQIRMYSGIVCVFSGSVMIMLVRMKNKQIK